MHEQTLKDLGERVDRGRAIQDELASLKRLRVAIEKNSGIHTVSERGDMLAISGHAWLRGYDTSRKAIDAAAATAAVQRIAERQSELEDEFANL